VGLRKALEFLVKDFAISRDIEHADAIKDAPHGTCIQKYVADTGVKKSQNSRLG